jgi:EmrB/QacA subfamily drug resistance transporter
MGFLCFSLLVISLDTTAMNMALPSISRDLGSSASGLQWIVDAYILVFASLLLTMGSIGDRVGRKKIMQLGLLGFGLFSLGGALSSSTGMLIGMRAAMGLAGAAMMPSTLSILTATFRNPKERAQAIALWAATFGLGLGIGPLVGGWLIEKFDWSWVFYINIPIVAIGLIGGYFFVHDSRDEHPQKIDIPGSVLSIAGLFALVYGIIEGGADGWTAPNVLFAFGAAVVLLAAFGIWEWRSPHPMLPLGFFRNMSFTGANMALTLVSFALMGANFFVSQYFQSVHGYSPFAAGVRLLPMALVSFVASALSAKLAQRIGTKIAVGLGILTASAGLFYLSQVVEVDTSYPMIVIGMCIMSLGMGMAMSPATNSIMGSLPVNRAGVGSAMNDTTRLLGGALGVAILGSVMNSIYISKIDVLNGTLSPDVFAMVRSSIQGAHVAAGRAAAAGQPGLANTIVANANEAFVSGMVRATLIAGIVMAAAAVVTFIILPMRVRHAEEEQPASPEKAPPAEGG